MKEHLEMVGFALLAVGTFGLLANEFALSWGRTATLLFAAANVLGFLALGAVRWGKDRDS